ncbi:MAG TPA: DUF1127 domain-containing protein [Stellaceae bacterium]|nr:DUF1127 domain-containing protein [Stellaceae bacterium]
MSTLYHRRAAARINPANDNRLPADLSSPPTKLAIGWSLLKQIVLEWRRRSRSRQTLAGLGSHELRDIGLTIHDQERECGKPFWRA